jgi:hypothetical protein
MRYEQRDSEAIDFFSSHQRKAINRAYFRFADAIYDDLMINNLFMFFLLILPKAGKRKMKHQNGT